jgi:predicted alpha/beta hydrolase
LKLHNEQADGVKGQLHNSWYSLSVSERSAQTADSAQHARAVARESFSVTCSDGWVLVGEIVVDGPPVAVAVVGHAMMVDRRTLDRPRGRGLVSTLAAEGVACVVADLRGHGNSGPRADAGGEWGYDDLVEQDVPTLVAFARTRFPSLPLVCVGHSLFGHAALAHLSRHPDADIDGLALLAVNAPSPSWDAGLRSPLRIFDATRRRAGIELMALLTRVFGRLPARRLRYGTDDEAAGYVRDFVRNGRMHRWRARDGFDYFDGLTRIERPLYAITGAGDRFMSPPTDARAIAERVRGGELHVVGRVSGLGFDPDHMGLVLDERARPAWRQVAAFIRRIRSARPTR